MARFNSCQTQSVRLSLAVFLLSTVSALAQDVHLPTLSVAGQPPDEAAGLQLTQPAATGSRLGLTPLETPASVDVITEETIRARGYVTVTEAVSCAPASARSQIPAMAIAPSRPAALPDTIRCFGYTTARRCMWARVRLHSPSIPGRQIVSRFCVVRPPCSMAPAVSAASSMLCPRSRARHSRMKPCSSSAVTLTPCRRRQRRADQQQAVLPRRCERPEIRWLG